MEFIENVYLQILNFKYNVIAVKLEEHLQILAVLVEGEGEGDEKKFRQPCLADNEKI